MNRFLQYTKGREPVLSANLLAAILLGFIVKATEQAGIYTWDEFSLTAAGVIALAVATWIARSLAWAPASAESAIEEANQVGFDTGWRQRAEQKPGDVLRQTDQGTRTPRTKER